MVVRAMRFRTPSVIAGTIAGALATIAFTAVHDLWILDIWDMVGPMVTAGAICGGALAWSYRATPEPHSARAWVGFNALTVLLLVALGAVSFVVLTPRYTFAEVLVMEDPLGVMLPLAVPLMVAAGIVGTVILWVVFGRSLRALLPIFLGHGLLVFLVGHNLALLGLLEFSSNAVVAYAEFVGLTVFLGASYLAFAWVVDQSVRLVRSDGSQAARHA